VVSGDNDKQAKRFFNQPENYEFITQNKVYPPAAQIQFHFADYRNALNEAANSSELFISQSAGWVGQLCIKFLKLGGWLL